ncbi:MAG: hypothetical protein QOJ29_1922, partial [Thermoleophilaceae bacterium]|nr:hypothetical protein [Thermoleophilaceae bacterium]
MTRERITDVSLEQARAHEGSNSGGSTDLPGPNVPAIAALPALAVAAMLLLATYWDGAFDIRNWAPAGILALLVLASWMALGHTAPRTRLATASLVALWGYAAWTLLSTIWAPSPDLAWRGADRTILYATLYTIPVLTLFARKHMRLVGMLLVAGIAVIALITMVRLIRHGPDLFLAGRLDSPIRYRNATAGLFSFPVWPLIAFAAVRGASVVLRATCFAGAILCLGLAFLTQSRGVLLGLVIGGVVVLAFGPERLRRAWLSILAVGIIGAASGPLLAPYDAFVAADAVHISSRIDEAIGVLALVALGSFVIALVLAVLDNGLRGQDVRTAHSYAAGGLAVLTAFVLLAGLVKIGNPVSYAQSKWDEFTNVNAVIAGETRLGSVGGQRYDLWRVAVDEFKSRPLLGVGENNYQWDY